MLIKKMFLIHDWLYEDIKEAKKYEDGKDKPTPVYTLIHKEDDQAEINSCWGVSMFSTYEEALTEMKYSL